MKEMTVIVRPQTRDDLKQERKGLARVLKNYPNKSAGRNAITSLIDECERRLSLG